jgi:hypothetical protein
MTPAGAGRCTRISASWGEAAWQAVPALICRHCSRVQYGITTTIDRAFFLTPLPVSVSTFLPLPVQHRGRRHLQGRCGACAAQLAWGAAQQLGRQQRGERLSCLACGACWDQSTAGLQL